MTSGYLRGSNNLLAGASAQGGYTIEESLRFNSSQSSYLSKTFAAAGNRKTFTWSGWVKRGQLSINPYLFSSGGASTPEFIPSFSSANELNIGYWNGGSYTYRLLTTQVFRDPSAWYHIVVAWDTTQATASNRIKVYVNGVQVTAFSTASYPSLNYDSAYINTTSAQYIGSAGTGAYFDGYLTEVNFIDGQALTPSSFGDYNEDTGVWQPAKYAGTYGTNGFYLPMQLDNTTEGFNTVTYIGNNSTHKIGGVGFSPDLVWIKSRATANHNLYDSVRGVGNMLLTNGTNAELTGGELTGFTSDGFTLGPYFYQANYLGEAYTAWCWDAGGTTVSNTDGSITSSVRANPAYGFSVVTYTGNGLGATVGHSLGVAPSMVIVKERGNANGWYVYHSSLGNTKCVYLDSTSGQATVSIWNNTTPAATVVSFNGGAEVNRSGGTYVAYCFSEIAGYSKFGSYTGNGSATGPTVTTGFKPAFVMVKSASTGGWVMLDTTRDTVNPAQKYLYAQSSAAEAGGSVIADINSDGFQLKNAWTDVNGNGTTYIYMAFKDTREYAFWLDDSGNNNDWQPSGGITTESTVTDTPTPYADGGNYAVLNPLENVNTTYVGFSKGNLRVSMGTGVVASCWGTMVFPAGTFYFETTILNVSGGTSVGISYGSNTYADNGSKNITYVFNGSKTVLGTNTSYGAAYTTGDVIGVAVDTSSGTVTFYKNNVSQGLITNAAISTQSFRPNINNGTSGGYTLADANFGQRPFTYTPPTGFKSLHTGNLPDSAIENGSAYFDTVLYTGNAVQDRAVTGFDFDLDLGWVKSRSSVGSHVLVNSVSGGDKQLFSNLTNAEQTNIDITNGFTTGGLILGDNLSGTGSTNQSGYTYALWGWKAGGAAVTNTSGSITSQVSASPTAGFSVVTFSGASAGTVGHGLGIAPSMVIMKSSSTALGWYVYTSTIGASGWLQLNTTAAAVTGNTAAFGGTAPTSTVWSFGAGLAGTGTYVAYCFSEVSGYSKFGSYVGNGSTDGTFVYLGFRPAFVMFKSTGANVWSILDSSRDLSNVTDLSLQPSSSIAEETGKNIDFLSNGFKLRQTDGGWNGNGTTYIYMAFAENPFKNSLAR